MPSDDSTPASLRSLAALGAEAYPKRITIQVELRPPVRRLRLSARSPSAFRFKAISGEYTQHMRQLHEVLNSHALTSAHASFRLHHPGRPRRLEAEKNNLSRFVQLHFPRDANIQRILRDLRQLSVVKRAIVYTGSMPAHAQPVPLDPLVGQNDQWNLSQVFNCGFQWYLYRCNVAKAWQRVSGRNVVIADIDTGFNVNHQDLAPNIEIQRAYNSVSNTRGVNALPPGQDMDHGTGVLGIAGAAMNNLGIAGVAYNARLWPIEAQVGNGPAQPWEPIGHAIDWLIHNAPSDRRVVINLEFQVPGTGANIEQIPTVSEAIKGAIAKGFVVCVAAGNGNLDAGLCDDGVTPIEPTGSILVGATNYDPNANPRAIVPADNEGSNYGASITVSAPGDKYCDPTCDGNNIVGYTSKFGGTSGAAAKVAGVVALMLEANPKITHEEVKDILWRTGSALPPDPPYDIGVFLNASAAVDAALASVTP
jgi:subtilisin family serine protease